jgi:hypothetical protein
MNSVYAEIINYDLYVWYLGTRWDSLPFLSSYFKDMAVEV